MSAVLTPRQGIRAMTEADVPQVVAIEVAAHRSPWTAGIFADCLRVGYHCDVMEEGEHIVAYSVLSMAAGEAHLFNLCVDPASQGQGLGRSMLEFVLDKCRRHQIRTVFLEVRPSNERAIALYESAGFNETGRRKDYYPDGDEREDALIMALEL